MFDKDQAVAKWREQMTAEGAMTPEVLAELECHLRDDLEEQIESGLAPEEAFEAAADRIGRANALAAEFEKVSTVRKRQRRRYPMLALGGASTNCDIESMHTQTSGASERPWPIYLKGAGFLAPAVFFWAFCAMFLFPKVQKICQDAGLAGRQGDQASLFHAITGYHRTMGFVAEHGVFVLLAIIIGVILLERRSCNWQRYRRASVGAAVFLVNSAVLILITAMFMLALLAAPALFHSN